jgi:NDP-mannose synthase
MQAIILAGGQGTRLKPYTTLLPKALVPLGDIPVLEVVLRQLKACGITDITLAVGHLAQLIEAYFGTGEHLGVTIKYARENQPLGTAGPLRAMPDLPDDFLVMNADILSDIDYQALLDAHRKQNAWATIAVYRRTSRIDFGTLEFDANTLQIQDFIEKPILEHSVSMGIYVFNRQVRELIPAGEPFGFDQLMKALIQKEAPVYAFPFNGYWLDIGRVEDYETAVNDFETLKCRLLPEASSDTPRSR